MVAETGDERHMGLKVWPAVLAACLCLGACQTASKCPKPIAYDDATLKKIQQALTALPPDNVLHQAMSDYEQERDDLRFCR
ncbi:MAG TPA: hypothetical protein VFA12_05455 [Stellaceae bacterium]|nr:hypothetical protein [Stellaceae bacterium]